MSWICGELFVTILVLGYGSSGRAAEKLARKLGYDVEVLTDEKSTSSGKDVAEDSSPPRGGQETSATNGGAAFAVVSPGVPLTSPLIAECRGKGIPLKSELQFGCEELKRQGWKLLAVTGSKGKSSVVKVVADAINLAGMHAVACGNYGRPVSDVALELGSGKDFASPVDGADGEKASVTSITGDAESFPLCRYAVVEVSSFMMETTELPADTFEAAAILNLQEDHLDRHGSVEVYHALKRKLLTMAKRGVVAEVSRPPRGGQESSATLELFAGSYFDNDILKTNARCAVALMRTAGLSDADIAVAFKEFVPLPHRMNRVATIDGIEYIDDSKATSLAALSAGVVMASTSTFNLQPRIRLIAGGLPKGDDPKSVVSILTERVKKVYLIGQSAEAFASAWKSCVDCEICGTMEAAVAAVKRDAAKGDKVLLSPGTASFDQFKSFGERGDVFARLVKKEK